MFKLKRITYQLNTKVIFIERKININRNDFSKRVASDYQISQSVAKEWVDAIFDTFGKVIAEEEYVTIHNFGSFKHKWQKEKLYKHPVTKETSTIPGQMVVKFKPSDNIIGQVKLVEHESL